jgi:hypothetical protein
VEGRNSRAGHRRAAGRHPDPPRGGLIDIGTQCSLVRRASGKFVFLDSYTLDGAAQREADALTNGGKDVEAILNLHPFHTVHVRAMHQRYPKARLYGTARHPSRLPGLPWEKMGASLHDRILAALDRVSGTLR